MLFSFMKYYFFFFNMLNFIIHHTFVGEWIERDVSIRVIKYVHTVGIIKLDFLVSGISFSCLHVEIPQAN